MKLLRLPSLLFALPLLFLATHGDGARADTPSESSLSVYSQVGPFGLGLGVGMPIGSRLNLRLGAHSGNFGGIKGNEDLSDINYDVRAKTKPGLSALADWYPMEDSGFRLTGGLIYGRTEGELSGRPDGSGNYNINGRNYAASQVGGLNGTLKYNSISPYLGIGWESKPAGRSGWRFVSDLGFYYLGKAESSLAAGNPQAGSALKADIEAERKDLEKKGVGLGLMLGVAYAF